MFSGPQPQIHALKMEEGVDVYLLVPPVAYKAVGAAVAVPLVVWVKVLLVPDLVVAHPVVAAGS